MDWCEEDGYLCILQLIRGDIRTENPFRIGPSSMAVDPR